MRDRAIKKVIDLLENIYYIDIGEFTVLDLFARDATWQTKYYADKVKKVHAWEIEEKFRDSLKNNLPNNATITIGDSHKMIRDEPGSFDLIVLDNPQGCYGTKDQYCEHFDSLLPSLRCLTDNSIIIFNVKTKPFNFEDKLQWQQRRKEFYKVEDSSNITLEFMNSFYDQLFVSKGFRVGIKISVVRPQEDGLFMFVYQLERGEIVL